MFTTFSCGPCGRRGATNPRIIRQRPYVLAIVIVIGSAHRVAINASASQLVDASEQRTSARQNDSTNGRRPLGRAPTAAAAASHG